MSRPLPGSPPTTTEWLMQPSWVPLLRAGIGAVLVLTSLVALAIAWPWGGIDLGMLLWLGLGVFLIWASRSERSGTRLIGEEIVVTAGRRVTRLTRADILDLRHDSPDGTPWRVQAVCGDGSLITLLGVPPAELERVRAWHRSPTPRS
ncbi:hypothetical protein [Ornithinimicrobium panacihumi]|uniref:hypothetical protein n=1 Tax=Ornithinimicrobium panacihumi TaxID=2008449 RepID=UPI003F899B80